MYKILADGARQFNLHLTEAQLNAFDRYSRELIARNRQVNLTRIVEPESIAIKHFLDSLSICLVLPALPSDFALIDVGSGAGFPGLPLKIARPEIRVTLVEATAKKTAFLKHIVDTLSLTNVTVVTARAEEVGQQPAYREQYDVAVGRAVAQLAVLAEYTLPLVKVKGWVVGQKGQHPAGEIEAAANALRILGGRVCRVIPVEVAGLAAARHLVVIQKIKPTPRPYPRRPGLPAKKPI